MEYVYLERLVVSPKETSLVDRSDGVDESKVTFEYCMQSETHQIARVTFANRRSLISPKLLGSRLLIFRFKQIYKRASKDFLGDHNYVLFGPVCMIPREFTGNKTC